MDDRPAMTQSKQEARVVEVTQADRDAAAGYLETMHPVVRWDQGSIDGVRGGQGDGLSLVQAFARHRLATLPPLDSSGDARERARELLADALDMPVYSDDSVDLSDLDQVQKERALDAIEAALSRQEGVGELVERLSKLAAEDERVGQGRCATSIYLQRAKAMRDAIAALRSQDRPAPDESELRKALEWIAGHDAAANGLDGFAFELVESFTSRAHEALASRSAPDGWVPKALRVIEVYGQHRPGCNVARALPFQIRSGTVSCTCGFDAARQALATSPSALDGEGVE